MYMLSRAGDSRRCDLWGGCWGIGGVDNTVQESIEQDSVSATINVNGEVFLSTLDHMVGSFVRRLQGLAHSILVYKHMSACGQGFTHVAVSAGQPGRWWANLLHECLELTDVVQGIHGVEIGKEFSWQAKSCAVNHLGSSMVSDYCGGSAKTGDPPLNEGLCYCICTDTRDGEGFQPPRESVHAHQKVRESTGYWKWSHEINVDSGGNRTQYVASEEG